MVLLMLAKSALYRLNSLQYFSGISVTVKVTSLKLYWCKCIICVLTYSFHQHYWPDTRIQHLQNA